VSERMSAGAEGSSVPLVRPRSLLKGACLCVRAGGGEGGVLDRLTLNRSGRLLMSMMC
jgi:hypothetical protein